MSKHATAGLIIKQAFFEFYINITALSFEIMLVKLVQFLLNLKANIQIVWKYFKTYSNNFAVTQMST